MVAMVFGTLDAISKLGPVVAAASALVAAFGAIYVYRQYRRTQDWRKGDLAAALMQKLESDEELGLRLSGPRLGDGTNHGSPAIPAVDETIRNDS